MILVYTFRVLHSLLGTVLGARTECFEFQIVKV